MATDSEPAKKKGKWDMPAPVASSGPAAAPRRAPLAVGATAAATQAAMVAALTMTQGIAQAQATAARLASNEAAAAVSRPPRSPRAWPAKHADFTLVDRPQCVS